MDWETLDWRFAGFCHLIIPWRYPFPPDCLSHTRAVCLITPFISLTHTNATHSTRKELYTDSVFLQPWSLCIQKYSLLLVYGVIFSHYTRTHIDDISKIHFEIRWTDFENANYSKY